jgi:hypothetical protein
MVEFITIIVFVLGVVFGMFVGVDNRAVQPEEFHRASALCNKNGGLKYFNSDDVHCKDGALFKNKKN